MKEKLKQLFVSITFAGIIVLLIGIYFWAFKAGLPYQDPTTDMTLRWMAYNFAGEACMLYGAITFTIGLIGHIICKLAK